MVHEHIPYHALGTRYSILLNFLHAKHLDALHLCRLGMVPLRLPNHNSRHLGHRDTAQELCQGLCFKGASHGAAVKEARTQDGGGGEALSFDSVLSLQAGMDGWMDSKSMGGILRVRR